MRLSTPPPSAPPVPAAGATKQRVGLAVDRLVWERELDVGPRDRNERATLGGAAVQRRELRVDDRDEVEVTAVEVVGGPAPVPLLGQRHVADDPVAVRFQHDARDASLHVSLIGGSPTTLRLWPGSVGEG